MRRLNGFTGGKNCHLPADPVYIMERGKVGAIGTLADLNEDLVQKYLSA
ncbi:hypothetical protein KO507_01690 [Gilvimarinus agarilyticus]|nr:hypothetical protein [Gilvimarinus sp. 2_MG-2023]MBU2884472.1 hypothetical protein [Gilvimarinus agarilyticus]MDO6569608.1 hypothetical protein [Gilvimarinus sp. 2_MG-2023]